MAEAYKSYWYAEVDADDIPAELLALAGADASELPFLQRSTHPPPRVLICLPDGIGPADAVRLGIQGRVRNWQSTFARVRGDAKIPEWVP